MAIPVFVVLRALCFRRRGGAVVVRIDAKIVRARGPGRELSPYGGGGIVNRRHKANRRFEYLFSISDQPIAEPEKVEAEGVEPSSRGRLMPTSTCVGHSLSHHSRRR